MFAPNSEKEAASLMSTGGLLIPANVKGSLIWGISECPQHGCLCGCQTVSSQSNHSQDALSPPIHRVLEMALHMPLTESSPDPCAGAASPHFPGEQVEAQRVPAAHPKVLLLPGAEPGLDPWSVRLQSLVTPTGGEPSRQKQSGSSGLLPHWWSASPLAPFSWHPTSPANVPPPFGVFGLYPAQLGELHSCSELRY